MSTTVHFDVAVVWSAALYRQDETRFALSQFVGHSSTHSFRLLPSFDELEEVDPDPTAAATVVTLERAA